MKMYGKLMGTLIAFKWSLPPPVAARSRKDGSAKMRLNLTEQKTLHVGWKGRMLSHATSSALYHPIHSHIFSNRW